MPVARLACSLSLALLLAAAPVGSSLAQDPEGEPPIPAAEPPIAVPEASAPPPPGIEAIEVTGERLNDANVQDEAQAISAFTAADLDRANIVNAESLQFNVPGLHVGQSANAPIITLRGIGTENSSLTGEPGVAFHVDGINFGRPSAARVAFFDLETLDVKRGPQGLLGGKNSTSGSINLFTKKPTDEFEVGGDVLFGNYDRVRMRAALNVPMGEYLAARVAFYQAQRDGFLDNPNVSDSNDPFDEDDLGLRGHLKVTPHDRLQFLFSYNYYRQDGVGPQSDPIGQPQRVQCAAVQAPTLEPSTGNVLRSPAIPTRDTVSYPNAACFTYQGNPEAVVVPPSPIPQIRYRDPFTGEILQATEEIPGTFPPQTRTVYPQFVFTPATEDGDPRKVYLSPERRDLVDPQGNPFELTYGQRNRFWGWTTAGDWDVPAAPLLGETHLKLIGGYQKLFQQFGQDFDGTDRPLSGYRLDPDTAKQWNITGEWSGAALSERLEWTSSLFYLHEKALRKVAAPGLIPGTEASQGLFSEQTTNNHSYGAALHGKYALTDALSWSLGGRWIRDDRHTRLFRQNLAETAFGGEQMFRGCHGALLTRGPRPGETGFNYPQRQNRSCEETYRGTMWGSGLEWRPFGDEHLLYTRIDRGWKSGGFRAGTIGEYEPEKIWAYAAGTKSEFFDQRLRVNFEGFVYNYQDLQIVILDGFALRTENTDARMYGWDLESQFTPIEGLTLSAVLSYLHTETIDYYSLDPTNTFADEIDRFVHDDRLGKRELTESRAAEGSTDPSGPTEFALETCTAPDRSSVPCGSLGDKDGLDSFSGNHLSRSPAWKYTLSGEYEIPLGSFGSLTPRVQYTWQDDTYFRAFNQDFDLQEAYHLTNLKLIWTSPEQMWTVEAFIDNVEDEAVRQNILIGPRGFGGPPFAWYNPPRFYGVQVGFRY
jgi:iron complex outermembrane receptor protein